MQIDSNSLLSKFRNWKNQQRLKKALIESGQKPKIIRFEAGNVVLVENGKIRLSWEVENAHRITINNGVGEVEAKGEMYVRVPQNATKYKIQVKGGKHKLAQSIPIFPGKFDSQPLADLFAQSHKNSFDLPKVSVHTPSFGKEKVDKLAFSFLPELSLPNTPTKAEIQKLKSELTDSVKLKTVEELQKKLKELKRKDLLHILDSQHGQ